MIIYIGSFLCNKLGIKVSILDLKSNPFGISVLTSIKGFGLINGIAAFPPSLELPSILTICEPYQGTYIENG